MDNSIKTFVNGIIEKTGLVLSVFGEDGTPVAGEQKTPEALPTAIDGVFSDVVQKRTLFTVNYCGKTYIGKIGGASKNERIYAEFIRELAGNASSRATVYSKTDFFKAALFGEIDTLQVERLAKKFGVKNSPACAMLIAAAPDEIDDVIHLLENYNAYGKDVVVKIDAGTCVLIKFIDDAANEYHSLNEYANFLVQSAAEEAGKRIRVFVGGTVKEIAKIFSSFSQAVAAERFADAFGSSGGVHSFKEYLLVKVLEDIPKEKLDAYLDILESDGTQEIFSDSEMRITAEEFLENSLNQSETARKLYLHRNTLTYRLDKIEKLTGLDLRRFSDALTFRFISILYKITGKK